MSKFLKLTTFLINTNDIHQILIRPNKFIIHVVSKRVDGFTFGVYGFGMGNLSSSVSEIEVCEKKHVNDYKKMSEWVDNMSDRKTKMSKRYKRFHAVKSV